MTLLPTGAGSNGFWWAMGCNDSGTVVGQGDVAGGNAVMWTSSGGITPIPRIGGATGSTAEAYCITNTGLIGGEDDGVGHAFVYNTNTSTVYDCGPDTSAVFGISNSGLAVGMSYGSRSFLWTASGGATTLPSVNATNSISANGTYVAADTGGTTGQWGTGNPAIYNTVTQSTTTIGSSGICWSVNNSGTAVGSATIDGTQQAFLYSGGTLYSLTDLLASALPAGVTLNTAVSINNNGVILAKGDNPEGRTNGTYFYNTYILTLPGDANFDGQVDINDLTIVLAHYDTTVGASWATGDFLGDGKVNINDLTIVLAHYGQNLGSSAGDDGRRAGTFGDRHHRCRAVGFAGLRGKKRR